MNIYNTILVHALSMDYFMSDRKKNIDAISADPFVRIMNQNDTSLWIAKEHSSWQ